MSSFEYFHFSNILIVNNNQVKLTAINEVKKITNLKSIEYDFTKLQLQYFKSFITNLNGYAGINTVYTSIDYIYYFYSYLFKFNKNEKLIILKLNFFRLVLNEMTHVILRNSLNDINDSTTELIKSNKTQLTSGKNDKIFEEAGIMSENKIFGGKINWIDSAKEDNFNIKYCTSILQNLEENLNITFDGNEQGR